jgi:hypothetical protein
MVVTGWGCLLLSRLLGVQMPGGSGCMAGLMGSCSCCCWCDVLLLLLLQLSLLVAWGWHMCY